MNKGLTSKELKTFKELLIKANYEQLGLMFDSSFEELNTRLTKGNIK